MAKSGYGFRRLGLLRIVGVAASGMLYHTLRLNSDLDENKRRLPKFFYGTRLPFRVSLCESNPGDFPGSSKPVATPSRWSWPPKNVGDIQLQQAGSTNGCVNTTNDVREVKSVKNKIQLLLQQLKEEYGIPGLVCAVSVDGQPFLVQAMGFVDVENGTECCDETVMRIASISKAFTAIAVAKLLQDGKINLDASVQDYVPDFPTKVVNGEEVVITPRHLLNHTSGIRHYDKTIDKEEKDKKSDLHENKTSGKPKKRRDVDEYYNMKHFSDIQSALAIFKDDELHFAPGTDFLYSTFGYILLSAVIEKASGQDYLAYMKGITRDLNIQSLIPEDNDQIIHFRARHYQRKKAGHLENCPYVDNSYKWAGGGFMSNVQDLLKLAHCLLYSYQNSNNMAPQGYLRSEIVKQLWSPLEMTIGKKSLRYKDVGYGLGWCIRNRHDTYGTVKAPLAVYHEGGAVGASSILMIIPNETPAGTHLPVVDKGTDARHLQGRETPVPKGVVIAIIVNLEKVELARTAFKIAEYVHDL